MGVPSPDFPEGPNFAVHHVLVYVAHTMLIPAPLVQPMALVLHELMSNAQRHGARSGRSGTVEVDWSHADGRLRLTWREQVTREVVPPKNEGVGFKLVKSVVERQIGGDLGVEWLSDGLLVDLAVPLDDRSACGA